MRLIDTHSHLYDQAFDADRDQAVRRAINSGVNTIMLPAIDSQTHGRMLSLADAYPEVCFPMIGLHPTSVNENPEYLRELEIVEQYLAAQSEGGRRFYGVGEIGLDLYWSQEWLSEQTDAFTRQIELALRYDLPIVVHTRSAWTEMINVLNNYKGTGLRGIMHSFSGTLAHYKTLREIGDFLFGIGGVVTFKNSELAEVVEQIPLEEIALETDCPYLTPVPFRGKRNESSYTTYICDKISEIKGVPAETVAAATTRNALAMFGLE